MRLYLSIFFTISSIFLFGNPSSTNHVLDYVIVKDQVSDQETTKELYTYDNTGLLSSTKGFINQSGTWFEKYNLKYSYDSKSNITSKEESVLDNETGSIEPKYKYNFTYDANGNYLSEEYFEKITSESDWSGIDKFEYTYSDAKIKEVINYKWNNSSKSWVAYTKYAYNYDSFGHQSEIESYTYNQDTQLWMYDYKDVKIYSDINTLISETNYVGNTTYNEWIATAKTEYIYNANVLEQKISSTFTGTIWQPETKAIYSYTAGDVSSIKNSIWDKSALVWVDTYQDSYTYTGGKVSAQKIELWNLALNKWTLSINKSYTYTATSSEEIILSYDYKGLIVGTAKNYLKVNSDGKTVEKKEYKWDSANSKWTLLNQELFEYNASQLAMHEKNSETANGSTTGVYKISYNFNSEGDFTDETIYSWDTGTNNWIKYQTKIYYYTSGVTIIDDVLDTQNIKIWTSTDRLHIDSVEQVLSVQVYTVVGKQIYSGTEKEISTINWQKGVYIVVAKAGNGQTKSVKIMVD